jgi:ribosomal protein S18 acetylase RimI-like enzyme
VTVVRPAAVADMIGLLAIEDEFREAGTPEFFLFDDSWFERKIFRDEILVADDDEIIGYLTWTSLWRLPWIEFARVVAARRREGVGRSMVSALEERLRAAGGWMLISSSTGTDKDAIAWHRAIGFKDGGRIEWGIWKGAPPEALHYKELQARG